MSSPTLAFSLIERLRTAAIGARSWSLSLVFVRTEIPELKTQCKSTKRSSSVEGTSSQSGCGPDFSSSRFCKVDYVLVNMRLARTHRGPRRTRYNLLRLDIVDFQAFDWSSYQKTSGETADTFVDSKTSRCSRWFAADAGRSHATTRGGHCNR